MAFPDAIVNAKRMGSIPGYQVEVVCGEPPPGWEAEDHSLDDYVAHHFGRVIRVERSRIWDYVRLGPLSQPVLGVARPPDQFRPLNHPAEQAAARLLSERRYDAVVSWSQMHSVQLVGASIRRRIGIPWLAYFGDPWAEDFFASRHALERRINRRLERRVFASADRLLFPAWETFEPTMAAYPDALRAKVRVLPHAFDPELYPRQKAGRDDGQIVIRYVGAFYGKRTPAPLIEALEQLGATDPELLRRTRVEVVGRVEPEMLERAQAALPRGTFEVRPHVDYVRSLELMAEADGLVVVDAPMARSPFLPSKLIDYIGSGRPIAALTPPGPAADVTRRLGGPVADPSDPRACARAMRELLEIARRSGDAPFGDPSVRAEYSLETTGREMANILDELTRDSSR